MKAIVAQILKLDPKAKKTYKNIAEAQKVLAALQRAAMPKVKEQDKPPSIVAAYAREQGLNPKIVRARLRRAAARDRKSVV